MLGDIGIRVDSLSAWFILIINFTSVTGVLFGTGYLKAYENPAAKLTMHWALFILFQLSMIFVCLVQNGLVFLIVWEIMSLSSMMLVIFDHHTNETLKAGINYMIQMHISVVLLTVGFIWVYFETGSFSFDSIGTFFQGHNNIWLFLIFFIGFGFKAGFIPFHSWLPHAHPAAPSHISGVMSGVIVKLGIYGIIRMISYLHSDLILLGEIILTVSVLTGLYGILNAAVHRDFKRMLAYCTIENIGIIGIGIGIGLIGLGKNSPMMYLLGFSGALLHVLNHSLFKSLLFYSAGSIYQQTHTRDMEKLGGIIKSMPKTAFIFLTGAIAIGGMPPLNGFVSEFVIFSGLIEGIQSNSLYQIILMVLVIAGLSVIGGLSLLTFTKSFGTVFLGQPRVPLAHKPHEVSNLMLAPQYLIITIMLSIAFIPQFYLNILKKILSGTMGTGLIDSGSLDLYSKTASNISLISVVLIGVVGLVWTIRRFVMKKRSEDLQTTWGCGYTDPKSSMQYTGKSFSKPLGKIFNFVLLEKKQYNEIKTSEIFPDTKKYDSHYLDFFESTFVNRINNLLFKIFSYLRFIQNGRTQSYVLYGILFILIIFLLNVFRILV
ncbi:MAG: hypothetical protein A2X22_07500 [Bacteroidetes bacterium GWF2_49_14]|nr:MAG: hypothetical protein A2X22_07500 [Bacteroidetes bacterium GWF2_49_14]